jgi:hypothetical protein
MPNRYKRRLRPNAISALIELGRSRPLQLTSEKGYHTVPNSSKVPATREENRPSAFKAFLTKMEMTAEIDAADTENSPGTVTSTVERIVTAQTEEEMWDAGDLANIGGRNMVDIEQQVRSFQVKYSTGNTSPSGEEIQSAFRDSQGRGMYLLVEAVKLETGEELVWNTSAPDIVSKLMWLQEHNRLPADVVIRGIDLGGGKTYLRLKPVPKRAIRAD